jgi:hypothetical protein
MSLKINLKETLTTILFKVDVKEGFLSSIQIREHTDKVQDKGIEQPQIN